MQESKRIELRLNDDMLECLNQIAKKEMKKLGKTERVKDQKIIYAILLGLLDNDVLQEYVLKDLWCALRLI